MLHTYKKQILLLLVIGLPIRSAFGQQWKVYDESNSDIPANTLGSYNELSIDEENNLWITHKDEGIVKYSPGQDEWTYHNTGNSSLPGNGAIQDVLADGHFVWATNSNGLYRYDGTSWQTISTEHGGYSLACGKENKLWIAKLIIGAERVLVEYDGHSFVDKSAIFPATAGSSLLSEIAINSEDTIWIARTTEVHPNPVTCILYVIDDDATYKKDDCDVFEYIVQETEFSPNDDLWLGTIDFTDQSGVGDMARGVACLKNETGLWSTYHTGNSPLPDDHIQELRSDAQSRIWIGTYGGLARFDGTGWKVFTKADSPLSDDTITGIAIDTLGTKWIATPKGLVTYNEINPAFSLDATCGLTIAFTDQSQSIDGPITAWQWDFAGLGTSPAQNPDFTFPQAGTYSVSLLVTDGAGNRNYITREITVSDLPTPFTLGPDIDICESSVSLSGNISGAAGYTWTLPTGEIAAGEPVITAEQNGTYALQVTTANGCSYSDTILVTLNSFTTTDFGMAAGNAAVSSGSTVYTGTTITFTAMPGDTFAWDFGDGTTASASPVTYSYAKPGTYTVRLVTGTDDRQCPVFSEKTVEVIDIFIANAITPNRDGRNDELIVEPVLDEFSMKVINRWGQPVFEQSPYEGGFSGKDLESGIYFYELSFRNFSNVFKGYVHIIK